MKVDAGARRLTFDALAVFGLAFVVRALHLANLRASPFLDARLGDAATYDRWARGIAAGDWLGHEVFLQAPLYPYFLGTLYATLGDHPLLVRGVQCLLSALACALLANAGALLFSRGAGLAAGLLLALYAPSIFLDALIQKSVLDLFFVCLALWLAVRLSRAPGLRLAAALGVALGLLVLARENALLLAGVLGLWLLLLPGLARPRRLALAAAFAAGVGATLAPVALRNWWVGGELHLTSSQFGFNFFVGNNAGATGGYSPIDPRHGVEHERRDNFEIAERAVGRRLSPREASEYWTQQALAYITSQPVDWLRRTSTSRPSTRPCCAPRAGSDTSACSRRSRCSACSSPGRGAASSGGSTPRSSPTRRACCCSMCSRATGTRWCPSSRCSRARAWWGRARGWRSGAGSQSPPARSPC
jgi:4-amino-4-deoxy-L-arabinose transferase-like glycosyltransferase